MAPMAVPIAAQSSKVSRSRGLATPSLCAATITVAPPVSVLFSLPSTNASTVSRRIRDRPDPWRAPASWRPARARSGACGRFRCRMRICHTSCLRHPAARLIDARGVVGVVGPFAVSHAGHDDAGHRRRGECRQHKLASLSHTPTLIQCRASREAIGRMTRGKSRFAHYAGSASAGHAPQWRI